MFAMREGYDLHADCGYSSANPSLGTWSWYEVGKAVKVTNRKNKVH